MTKNKLTIQGLDSTFASTQLIDPKYLAVAKKQRP